MRLGRVAVQQRVLPAYRAPFFELLGSACPDGLSLFAGLPLPDEQIPTTGELHAAEYFSAQNRYLFSPASRFFLCWQAGLIRWLEAADPAILVVEANPRYLSTYRGIHWMHRRGRPVLGWGLGAPPVSGWAGYLQTAERKRFIRRLDGLIAYSRRGAEEYRRLGFPQERIFVAPNSASPRPTRMPVERPSPAGGRANVLFVGRLQARKRLDLLFAACAGLPENLQPEVVIVGDGPARPDFEALARAVYRRVTFTGDLRGEKLAALFNRADLFVLPGTGGLAAQQALVYGLPVIVAQGDGTQEDMVREENGWVIPPGDVTSLQKTLQEALTDLPRLREMGRASFRIAREEINLEQMVAGFLQALRSVQQLGLRTLSEKTVK